MTDRWLLRRNSEFSRDSELRVPSAWCRPGPGVQLVTGDHWTLPRPNCADSEYSSDPLLHGNILRSPISYPLKIWMNWISAAVTKYCSILYSLLQCAVGRKHRQCVGVRHYHHYCRHCRGGEERGAASQKQSSLTGISPACCWVASLSHSEYQHSLALKRCHGPIEINPNDTCLTKNLTCLGTLSIEPYEPTCDVCRQADRQTNLQSSVVLFGMGNGCKHDKVCLLLF